MERLNYSEVVQTVLKNHVKNRSNSQAEVQLMFDTERDRYQVLNMRSGVVETFRRNVSTR